MSRQRLSLSLLFSQRGRRVGSHLFTRPNAPSTWTAGPPDGEYFFQVTDPNGSTLLSTDPVSNRRFRVTCGAITIELGNNTCPDGFLNTTNSGGVYKVWATPVAS